MIAVSPILTSLTHAPRIQLLLGMLRIFFLLRSLCYLLFNSACVDCSSIVIAHARKLFRASCERSHCQSMQALITLSAEANGANVRATVRAATREGPVSPIMQRQLTAFVEQPSKATYLAARDAVLRESPLPIVATDLADLEQLLDDDEHEAVLDRIDALPVSKVLAPRVHYLAAEAAEALRDSPTVELERSLFVLTLQGLLATGDGTRENPYIVCHASDEYDVLVALGREPAGQVLEEHDDRLFDILTCDDGREVWFDVTAILRRPPLRSVTAKRPKMLSRNRLRPIRTAR
jgi:hypothetical protein